MIVDTNFNVQVVLAMRQRFIHHVNEVPTSALVPPALQSRRILLMTIRHMIIVANVKVV